MKLLRGLGGLVLVGACGGEVAIDDDSDAQSGAELVEATSTTQALLSMTADVTVGAVGEQMAATVAAANSGMFFMPAGCVTATREGAAVAYTFTNCTGPYGLVNLNGTLRATFSEVTLAGRTVTVTGEIRAQGSTLRPEATARITEMGATRAAMVTLRGSATSPRGSTVTHGGSYMSTWDGTCLGLSGRVTSTAGAGSVTADLGSYRRCRGGCPEAGGRVTLTSGRGASIQLGYVGGAMATLTGSRGRTTTLTLPCGR